MANLRDVDKQIWHQINTSTQNSLASAEQFETSRSYALIITHNAKHNLLSMHMLEHNYSIYYQAYTAYIL